MRHNHDLAALGLLGAALALLMTVLMPRASRAATAPEVEWGLHRVDLERTALVVHSTWMLSRDPQAPVPLAVPLPADAEVTGAEAVTDDAGRVVALSLPVRSGGRVTMTTRMPWRDARRDESLPVLVPAGQSVHRVVLDPAVAFSPDPALGLVAQVGHYAPAEFDVVARHRFDARTDGNLRHVGAYYVRGRDLEPAGALRGEVTLQRQRMGRAALVAGGVFGLVVLGMVVAQRRLGRQVRYERAEAYLAEELRSIEHDEDGDAPTPTPTNASATTP